MARSGGDAEEELWHGTAANPIAITISIALFIAALIGALSTQKATGLVAVAALAVALPFTRLSVTIDRERLRVRLGPWGWPTIDHLIADIDWIESEYVTRRRVRLGVGVKGSRRRLKGTAVLIRPGEAVKLQGRQGRRFTVTVDGAAAAVDVAERLMGEWGLGSQG